MDYMVAPFSFTVVTAMIYVEIRYYGAHVLHRRTAKGFCTAASLVGTPIANAPRSDCRSPVCH